jgi:hypothetical protein
MIEEGSEEVSDGRPVDESLRRLTDRVERQLAAYRDGGTRRSFHRPPCEFSTQELCAHRSLLVPDDTRHNL